MLLARRLLTAGFVKKPRQHYGVVYVFASPAVKIYQIKKHVLFNSRPLASVAILTFSACEKDEADSRIRLKGAFLQWVDSFSDDGMIVNFESSAGVQAQAKVLVTSTDDSGIFC